MSLAITAPAATFIPASAAWMAVHHCALFSISHDTKSTLTAMIQDTVSTFPSAEATLFTDHLTALGSEDFSPTTYLKIANDAKSIAHETLRSDLGSGLFSPDLMYIPPPLDPVTEQLQRRGTRIQELENFDGFGYARLTEGEKPIFMLKNDRRGKFTAYFGKTRRGMIFPQTIPSAPEISVPNELAKEAARLVRERCKISAKASDISCVAKVGDAFVLRHTGGAVVTLDKRGSYLGEFYLAKHEIYIKDMTCFARPIYDQKIDGAILVHHPDGHYAAFAVDGAGNVTRKILTAALKMTREKLEIVILHGRAYLPWRKPDLEQARPLTDSFHPFELAELGGDGDDGFIANVPSAGDIEILSNTSFPVSTEEGYATNKSGILFDMRPKQIGRSDFYLMRIPNVRRYGEFVYDGTGTYSNLHIYKKTPEGAFRIATHEELVELLGDYEDAEVDPKKLVKPKVSFLGNPRIETAAANSSEQSLRVYTQMFEVKTPDFTRGVELMILADDDAQFLTRRNELSRMLRRLPIAMFGSVKRIELYPGSSKKHGVHTVNVGGSFSQDSMTARVFGFDERLEELENMRRRTSLTLTHELWHSLQGPVGSAQWEHAILAIAAGGKDEDFQLTSGGTREVRLSIFLSPHEHHGNTRAEFVAAAGEILMSEGKSREAYFRKTMPFAYAFLRTLINQVEIG